MNRKHTPQLNDKALELISAYLDGQLPEEQRKLVRQQLAQDAAFKQAFEDLRMTRLALRSAPQIKRRRSFTLTPAMVGQRQRTFGLQAASRLVAVVATVLLVAVVAGDVFFYRGAGKMSQANESFTADSVMQESDDMALMIPEEPSGGGGEPPLAMGAAADDEEVYEEAEADMVEEAVEAAPVVDEGGDDAAAEAEPTRGEGEGADNDTADDQGFAAPQATQTKEPEGTKVPETARAVPTDEPMAEDGTGYLNAEEPALGEPMQVAAPTEGDDISPKQGLVEQIPLVSLIELALLAVAIGSGAVALMSRRR